MELFNKIRLRFRLVLYFSIVVVISGAIATLVGIRLINTSIIKQAQNQVMHDLSSAWMVYNEKLNDLRDIVELTSNRFFLNTALTNKKTGTTADELENIREKYNLDFLTVTDEQGIVLFRARNPLVSGDDQSSDALVSRALRGETASATQIVPREKLVLESPELAERAYFVLKNTPKAKPTSKSDEDSGMVLKVVAPIFDHKERIIGTLYGGVLINRSYDIVDSIKETVYKGEVYAGKDIGTATIFQWDVRISTNVTELDGSRAIETRVSESVYDAVLINGKSWIDRAFVVRDWYITAYEPIRDIEGRIIGILYVGILEEPYIIMRQKIIWSMLKYLIIAVAVAMGIAFLLGRQITKPIAHLVHATRQIYNGFIPSTVKITSKDEIGILSESFNSMSHKLKQTLDEKDKAYAKLKDLNVRYLELLGFVTHELMQPLGVLKGYLTMMQQSFSGKRLSPEQKEHAVVTMLRNVNMLVDMSQTYLQLSKIESGQLEIQKERTNIYNDIIIPAVESARPKLMVEEMELVIDNENSLDKVDVWADPILLRIVYNNLISNAIKYGKRRGKIFIGFRENESAFQFNVKNEGEGIPADKLDVIFEKFTRLGEPSMRKQRGTGLGLYNTKEIVTKHGGKIWAESAQGEWTDIIFTLPKMENGDENGRTISHA
jgi:two-component system NtrC family sensor kinase